MERFIAAQSPAADLLKVAHHGSATSTTPELLAAVHPRFAVISVGHGNSFGHPRQVVLQRLQASQVRTYRTDFLGATTFLLDGKRVQTRVQPR
jgi:competence protein ComEC